MLTAEWPELPLNAWKETYATLHMWTQIVGKVRLALSPRVNHWADSGQPFMRSVDDRNAPHIPMVRFTWRLLDPAGKEVWKEGTAGLFLATGSRYYQKSKRGDFAAVESPGARQIDYYDFGPQGMQTAIVEEILDTQAEKPALPRTLPHWLVKTGEAYHRLPLTLDLIRPEGP